MQMAGIEPIPSPATCASAGSVGHRELAYLDARDETGVHTVDGRAVDPPSILEYTSGIKEYVHTSNGTLVAICSPITQSAP